MEEVIHEFKITETEDGYRIEIKGDKARIKKMIDAIPFGFGVPSGFNFMFKGGPGWGAGHGPRRYWKGRHRKHGRPRWRGEGFWMEDHDESHHSHDV